MSKVSYNDIEFGLVKTVRIEQKAKYDQSNTDTLYTQNRYTIRSILSQVDTTPLLPSQAGESPAETMDRIRHMLLQPRKQFIYESGGAAGVDELIVANADNDSDNGPKPIDCNITQVTDRTFLIDFTIDVCIADCDEGASQQFASNRFERTHDIDHKGYSTFTTDGIVFVRSDMRTSPDALRGIVTPPLPRGFTRKSSYRLREDGLALHYHIVDTEKYLMPPKNAVEASGRFTITTAPPGAILYGQVDLRLEGKKGQSKAQLLQTAVLLALRRLEACGIQRNPANKRPFVMGGALSEELFDNVVEVQLKGMLQTSTSGLAPNDRQQFFTGAWQGFFSGLGIGGLPALGFKAWKSISGVFDRDKEEANAAAAAASAAAAARATAEASKAQQVPADGDKPPQVPGATLEGFIDNFGAPIVAADQQAKSIDPGLRGNMNFMSMLAAAFRDPCVVEGITSTLAINPNVLHKPRVDGVANAYYNARAGLGVVQVANVASEQYAVNQFDTFWKALEDSIRAALGGDAGLINPSLDWRKGRLLNVDIADSGGGVIINQQESLAEFDQSAVKGDDFPGWYENWYCEIEHDLDMNQCLLPATAAGYAASLCRWANPLRTMRVRWSCAKAGFPPEIPVIMNDDNVITISHKMSLPTVEIAGDGQTPVFGCTGETVYQMYDETTQRTHYPVPPWLKSNMAYLPAPIPDPYLIVSDGVIPASTQTLRSQGSYSGPTVGS